MMHTWNVAAGACQSKEVQCVLPKVKDRQSAYMTLYKGQL
jgi:hypothetical protein